MAEHNEHSGVAATGDRVIVGEQRAGRLVVGKRFEVKNGVVTIQLSVSATHPKVLFSDIAEKVSQETVVFSVSGIKKCFIIEKNNEFTVQTDGCNLAAVTMVPYVDLSRVSTNDIYAILTTYGVEAAYAAIKNNVNDVFDGYGIAVNPRHLSLIADFMTQEGGYRPFNRNGLSTNTSFLQKASFETTTKILCENAVAGMHDYLHSPSARLVVGRVIEAGTGSHSVLSQF